MGEKFGPYVLESLIGRGAASEVFRAFDTVKGRAVALKRLPRSATADPEYAERFRRESELAARLRGPHVVPIHGYGEIDGRLFLDMRLVDGIDLSTILHRSGPMAPGRAVDIVGQVAGALDSAHRDGLVHRDVKPSNVLVDRANDADFVYLIDFGIARDTLGADLTATGVAVGTAAYMAPERFLGRDRGDHRVDVYALGCLLFELLTATRPFAGDDLPAQMYGHITTLPPRPTQRRPGLPPGLDDVVATAMAKDPDHRFGAAGALAAAARAALGGPPVRGPVTGAGPWGGAPAPRPAAGGFWNRRRAVASSLLGVLLVVAAVVVAVDLANRPAATPGGSSPGPESEAAVPRPALTTVVGTVVVGDLPDSAVLAPDGERLYVLNRGSDAISVVDTGTGLVTRAFRFPAFVQGVDISPDGSRAYATQHGVSLDAPGEVVVIDLAAGTEVGRIPVGVVPGDVEFAADGVTAYVANIGSDSVSVVDVASGTVTATIPVGDAPGDMVMINNAAVFVPNFSSDTVSVILASEGTVTHTIDVGIEPSAAAWRDGGENVFVTNSGSGTVSVIDLGRREVVETIPVGEQPDGIAVSPGGGRVYVANEASDTVSVIDVNRLAVVETIPVGDAPRGVAMEPDGSRVYVTNSGSGSVSVLDTGLG